MKPLRPTLRKKKRWIYVRFLLGKPDNPELWARKKIKRILGSWGYGMAVIRIERTKEGLLIAVKREWSDLVRGALVLGREPFIPVTYVSGTLRALKRKGFITEEG